jgi:hypothetical protein
VKRRRNLIALELQDCRKITNASIIRIAEGYPNLHSLDLLQCFEISNAGIISLAEK